MTQADSVHSTPRRFTPKIVGGTDFPSDLSEINERGAETQAAAPGADD